MRRVLAALSAGYAFLAVMSLRAMAGSIVNWENPPVSTLSGTPDALLEVFDITGQGLGGGKWVIPA